MRLVIPTLPILHVGVRSDEVMYGKAISGLIT